MKAEMVETENLKSIGDLYRLLEDKAVILSRDHQLTNVLVAYRNKNIPDEEKQWAQWELECFLFTLTGNRVFSYSYSTGNNIGEVQQFPRLDVYQSTAFDYLKKRARTSKNALLLARYNHLLWKAPKGVKHRAFAIDAIKAYIDLIKEYLRVFEKDQHDDIHLEMSKNLENLIELVSEVKDGVSELKDLIYQVLYKTPHIPFYVKHSLLERMLSATNVFKPTDFTDTLPIFETQLNAEEEPGDKFLWTNAYFDTAILIARKINGDFKSWFEKLGDYHVQIAERETQPERFWLKSRSYTAAIEAYRNSGNTTKKKRIEQRNFELKPQIKLSNIRIERSPKEIAAFNTLYKHIEKECNALLERPAEEIYANLADGWFFPSKETITKTTNKVKSSFDFFTVVQFDRNKNIKANAADNNEAKKFNEAYQNYLYTITLQYLHCTLIPGIKSGKLTYQNFIAFLSRHTWLGKPYIKTDLGGKDIEFNWLTLLAPAICDYFVQVQSWIWSNESYSPNFVLCIDSLTLKMEGLLRNFAERLNISTTIGGKKGTQEVYINLILDNEIIRQYFDADDIQFFRFLFVNEGGMNLRNNVAHCYYHFLDYNLDKMNLLLAALIRIAKYDTEES